MKKILILICIPVFFISCKKSNTAPTATLDVVGKWSLYSSQQDPSSGGLNVNATQYPCISNNVLQINADHTTSTSYTGTDTCYVTPNLGPLSPRTSIGIPGQSPFSDIWTLNGNDIYLGKEHGVISSSNNQLYITTIDTISGPAYSSPLIIKSVEIKQQ
jgi:hypothetical protein